MCTYEFETYQTIHLKWIICTKTLWSGSCVHTQAHLLFRRAQFNPNENESIYFIVFNNWSKICNRRLTKDNLNWFLLCVKWLIVYICHTLKCPFPLSLYPETTTTTPTTLFPIDKFNSMNFVCLFVCTYFIGR